MDTALIVYFVVGLALAFGEAATALRNGSKAAPVVLDVVSTAVLWPLVILAYLVGAKKP